MSSECLQSFQVFQGYPRIELVWVAFPFHECLSFSFSQYFFDAECGLGSFLQLLFVKAPYDGLVG